jgi:hypothetical protein
VLKFVGDFQQLRLQLQQACLQGGEKTHSNCLGCRAQL